MKLISEGATAVVAFFLDFWLGFVLLILAVGFAIRGCIWLWGAI